MTTKPTQLAQWLAATAGLPPPKPPGWESERCRCTTRKVVKTDSQGHLREVWVDDPPCDYCVRADAGQA